MDVSTSSIVSYMFDNRVSGNHRDIIPAMSVMTPMIIRGRVIGTLGD